MPEREKPFRDLGSEDFSVVGENLSLYCDEDSAMAGDITIVDHDRKPGVDGDGAGDAINVCVPKTEADWQSIIPSHFEILGMLGSGGMSTVLKVRDKGNNGRIIALKILREVHATDANVVARFLKESEIVSRLDHPGIVKVFGHGTLSNGLPYMELELVEGQSLSDLLVEKGHLSQYCSTSIAAQIALALDYARKHGVIHRDLKPANILIQKEESHVVAKVVDFGIAKTITQDVNNTAGLTRTGDIFGSPAYMSPEQCEGSRADTRSDIYSLGCIIYEMLTGSNPFRSDNPLKSILKHLEDKPEPFELEYAHLKITEELEKIVRKCLEKEPERRYRVPGELADHLQELMGTKSQSEWILRGRIAVASIVDGFLLFLTIVALLQILPAAFSSDELATVIQRYASLWVGFFIVSFCCLRPASLGKHCTGVEVNDSAGRRLHLLNSWLSGTARCVLVLFLCLAYNLVDKVLIVNHVDSNFVDSDIPETLLCGILILVLVSMPHVLNRIEGWRTSRRKMVRADNVAKPVFSRASAIWSMTILIASFSLLVLSTFFSDLVEQKVEADPSIAKSDVVYAIKDIPEDTIIPDEAVVKKRVLNRRAPRDALKAISSVVGKRAKYGISAGQIVKDYDVEPPPTSP
ncbi:MAG: protein kinase [Cyanobacteria bacterium]|nr:protein kinase [Cyanobacteriota bacterium]